MQRASKYSGLTGQTFGRLNLIKEMDRVGGQVMYLCECSCGNTDIKIASKVVSGHTRSCGCLKREPHGVKHGETKTRLYKIWVGMKVRCYNKTSSSYPRYGKVGVTVCDEWHKYEAFRDWSLSNDYSDKLTIDRIDNSKGYSPSNCRWADDYEQARNKSTNKLTANDIPVIRMMLNEGMTQVDVAKAFGCLVQSINYIVHGKQWADC